MATRWLPEHPRRFPTLRKVVDALQRGEHCIVPLDAATVRRYYPRKNRAATRHYQVLAITSGAWVKRVQ